MIRFVCTCGHRFEVADDLGGVSIQCPKCHLLVDVPTLHELEAFTDEGTYRVDGSDRMPADDPNRLADLNIIYSKDKVDDEGNEIDLRTLPAGQSAVPGFYDDEQDRGEIDLKPREPVEVLSRPKYDPETGELVRPIDLAPDTLRDTPPQAIPMAKPAIEYASGNMDPRVSPLKIAVELLMPMNIVVMFFVFCMHVFSGAMFVVMIAALFFLAPPFLILQSLMLSHYGNVVDDTGRNETEDLPRPLRNLSWYDDIWSPFVAMFGGLVISFALPAIAAASLLRVVRAPAPFILLLAAAIGTIAGPVVLLTTNTSGSTLNLRPDRLLGVVRACGSHYIGVTLLWLITWPTYLLGWWGFFGAMARSFGHEIVLVWIVRGLTGIELEDIGVFGNWLIVMPALLLGIYLMHYFCWFLGLLYKANHEQFPWVLQRHIRENKGPQSTHADRLGRPRRPTAGHLPPASFPSAPPPPPPAASRAGR